MNLGSLANSTSAYSVVRPIVVIEAKRKWWELNLTEVWEYRELLYFLAWRDLKARYSQTVIGVGWAIVQPLVTIAILTLVFGYWSKIPSDGLPYSLFAFTALLPWSYFAKSFERSGTCVANEANLITKVYFPRLILPLAATVGGLLDVGIGFVLLLVMMAGYGIVPTWGILALPLFLLMTLATALAVSLWFAALNVRYRDMGAVIPLFLQVWMFASPIAYPVSLVPDQWRVLYSLNPMVGVIEGFRWALLDKASPDFTAIGISTIVVIVLLYGGLVYFKRMEPTFADVI
jgi:lipopolysaccharide transport system permease protein